MVQANKDQRKTGEGGEPATEFDLLMEELIESQEESNEEFKNLTDNQTAMEMQEKEKTVESRKKLVMERQGQSKKRKNNNTQDIEPCMDKKQRRSSSDTFDLLHAKMEADMEAKKTEREIQNRQQNQFHLVMHNFNENMKRIQSNQMQQKCLC